MIEPIIAKKEVTKHILKTFDIRADKRLGQNFLIDEQVIEKIILASDIKHGDTVLEIGPGIGTLTQGLLNAGANVLAVEIDSRLLNVLEKTLGQRDNLLIVNDDILKLDIVKTLQDNNFSADNFKVVANLPYYITTPIILKLLEERLPIERIVTMVQKEVAERIVAKPGKKDYGVLTIAVQYYTKAEIAFVVPPTSFMPAPAVESAVIVCQRHLAPPIDIADEKIFFRTVKAAFAQRRKMLRSTLSNIGLSKERVQEWLKRANIDGSKRGETLSLDDFAILSNEYQSI